jgi:hypothetical protein
VRDAKRSFAERVAAAAAVLGEPGTTDGRARVWYGVHGRNIAGPFGCRELRIVDGGPLREGPTDHRHCGLPYSSIPPGEHYTGPGARWSSVRLQAELALQQSSPSATAVARRLGEPNGRDGETAVWLGIGPRDAEAPLTCWALRVGAGAALEEVELSSCGITWPPPLSAFEPGPTHAPVAKAPLFARCNAQCKPTEVCMLDRRIARAASLVVHDDDTMSARYVDGRSAYLELVQSCAPLPASCVAPQASCWWQRPGDSAAPKKNPGPCPPDTYQGHSYEDAEGEAPAHVTCFSRVDVAGRAE